MVFAILLVSLALQHTVVNPDIEQVFLSFLVPFSLVRSISCVDANFVKVPVDLAKVEPFPKINLDSSFPLLSTK